MPLTEESKQIRPTGLTATDMSAVMGKNPYRSGFDVYADKVAPVDHDGEADLNEAMELGIDLEPWLRGRYASRHQCLIVDSQRTFRHPDHEIALATPDGLIMTTPERTGGAVGVQALLDPDEDTKIAPEADAVFEAKTAGLTGGRRLSDIWGEPGTDDIPEHYLIQCQWQMFVCRTDECALAALLSGIGYREYRITGDEELWALMLEAAERFWEEHVAAKKPPTDVGPDESTKKALAQIYSKPSKVLLESTDDINAMALDLHDVREQLDILGESKAEHENRFRAIIGDAYGIQGPWGKYIWPQSKGRKKTDWKAVAEMLAKDQGLSEDDLQRLVNENTFVGPGGRTLRPYWNKGYFQED